MKNYLSDYTASLKQYGLNAPRTIYLIHSAYSERHRHWHTMEWHLLPLLKQIDGIKEYLTENEYHALIITAIFHDIVFDPRRPDNEMRSEKVFKMMVPDTSLPYYEDICKTITEASANREKTSELSLIFSKLDMGILTRKQNFNRLVEYEQRIFKEYQFADFMNYKKIRIQFLKSVKEHYKETAENVNQLIDYIKSRKPKIAVYVGSFDPFHLGHYNVIQKAEMIFDKVIIAIGINPAKDDQESVARRKLEIQQTLPYHQVEFFTGFFPEFLESLPYPTTVIRGVRNTTDLNQEIALQQVFRDLKPDINIAYFFSDMEYQHISSTTVRNFQIISPGSERQYLPLPQKNILDLLEIEN